MRISTPNKESLAMIWSYWIIYEFQIGDAIKDTMSKTLQDHYGIDLYEDNNRLITKAWDKAQEKVRAYLIGIAFSFHVVFSLVFLKKCFLVLWLFCYSFIAVLLLITQWLIDIDIWCQFFIGVAHRNQPLI